MSSPPRTFSRAHLEKIRAQHRAVDGYGRHHHAYLPHRISILAASLHPSHPEGLRWLDYGCGKGTFIEEIRPLNLFGSIAGYDPGVPTFSARPAGVFDLVTCLHVLDVVEPRYLDAVLVDICRLTTGRALFDVMTRPGPASPLRPHPPFHWESLVKRHMQVAESWVEFPGVERFERVLILAQPP